MAQVELAYRIESSLGEGALWDDRLQRLLWVDITAGEIHAYDPATGADRLLFKSGKNVGTVVQRERGGLAAALTDGFYFMNEDTGAFEKVCNPEEGVPGNRFNDGKCDPAGRFWAGTMGSQGGKGTGSLYRLDADLSCHRMERDIACSNGIAWSPDNKTMYYTDSPERVIWAYDYDIESGTIANRRTAVEIPEGEGVPDGFTADAEGMLWVAQWDGWQVSRYDPATGKKTARLDVPAAHVTSCALGGSNLDELYVTTARAGLSEEELAKQPLAGSLFVAKAGVKGMRACRFGG